MPAGRASPIARADGAVLADGTLERGAKLSKTRPSAPWVEIASDGLYARPAAGATWVLAPVDAEACPEVHG